MTRWVALFLVVWCASCTAARRPELSPVHGNPERYLYREVTPRRFLIWAVSDAEYQRALKEIGCGVCTAESVPGRLGMVEVLKQQEN